MHAGHAFAGHRDHGLIGQQRDRLHRIALHRPARGDFGAAHVGVDERAHLDRDRRAGQRNQRAGMQDLGAKVRHLGGFAPVELGNHPRVRHHARIRGEDAGHVFPQHHAARPQAAADERCGQIRSAAAHGGHAAIGCRADETGNHQPLRRCGPSLAEKRTQPAARWRRATASRCRADRRCERSSPHRCRPHRRPPTRAPPPAAVPRAVHHAPPPHRARAA